MLFRSKRFESSGFRGLHRFNEWLNKLAERGEDLSRGDGGDAVQIMTLHKSKGLEFPVVFVCDTSRLFNKKDSQSPVTVHPVLGLGPKVVDTARGVEYPRFPEVPLSCAQSGSCCQRRCACCMWR